MPVFYCTVNSGGMLIVCMLCRLFIPCSVYLIITFVYMMQSHGYQEQDGYISTVYT